MSSDQFMMLRMLNGGLMSGSGWIQVVFLAFLLGIPVFRPETIRRVSRYRSACVCFGLSLILPGLGTLLMPAMQSITGGGRAGNRFGGGGGEHWMLSLFSGTEWMQILSSAGPILFGVSVIFALGSVIPGFIPPQSSRPSERPVVSTPPAGGNPVASRPPVSKTEQQ